MKLQLGACLVAALSVGSVASAAELITKSRAEKGYAKRDRVFPVSSETVSPAQLHEVYGPRVDAGFEITRSESKLNGLKTTNTAPTAKLRGAVAGDILTLGLAGTRSEHAGKSKIETGPKERVIVNQFNPSLAITIADHVTLGASSDMSWLNVLQNADAQKELESNGFLRREAIGLSYHTAKWEVGVMHSTFARARIHSKDDNQNAIGFLLAAPSKDLSSSSRDLYVPANNMVYARGNVTNNLSFQGTLGHSEYDANVDGAKEIFADYRRDDRLAGQLQAVYWLNDLATRFSATASYKGATHATFGTEDNALGYRDTNLYGGALDAVFNVGEQAYLGLKLDYEQGERNQGEGLNRIAARERRASVGTSLSKTF